MYEGITHEGITLSRLRESSTAPLRLRKSSTAYEGVITKSKKAYQESINCQKI